MSDKYLDLVNTGFTKKLAQTLGLPRPAKLRRQGLASELVPVSGTVVVLGEGKDADAVANLLLQWDLNVRRSAPPSGRPGSGSWWHLPGRPRRTPRRTGAVWKQRTPSWSSTFRRCTLPCWPVTQRSWADCYHE